MYRAQLVINRARINAFITQLEQVADGLEQLRKSNEHGPRSSNGSTR